MSELVVVAFDSPQGADRLLTKLDELERDWLIDLDDAVVVVRNGSGRLRLKQSITPAGETRQGVVSGALFGSLVGALILNPLAGLVAGAAIGGATGALAGNLVDFEISDEFIRDVGRKLRPNSSALFLLVRRAKPEQLLKEIEGFDGYVLRSTLTSSQEARLGAALSRQRNADPPAPVPA